MTHPEEMQAVARKPSPERTVAGPDDPATALNEYVAARTDGGQLLTPGLSLRG